MEIPKKVNKKERQVKILKALEKGCTRTAAAGYAGITRMTFYNWMEVKAFAKHVIQAEANARVTMELSLADLAVNQKDRVALFFWLQNRARDDWKNVSKVDVEHSGHVDHNVTHYDFSGYTKEELKEEAVKVAKQLEQIANGSGNIKPVKGIK
ncbi:MAG TPA: hypothetical protein ENH19_02090 [Actinobacteria bacterium]|nr:hypothetical protein [Actinomycetes bacterium]HEX21427.1 hypothetical protein [Actinomycetota bacterium]